MKHIVKTMFLIFVFVVAGCVNTTQIDEVREMAAQAQRTAEQANEAAKQAQRTADKALGAASTAQASADEANKKIDRAFKKAMEK